MIGNDIVDLQLAKFESNWRRPKYLDKIFTFDEQDFIIQSINPELEVWKLWSRKEAAYKIYNRETGIRGFFPWRLECSLEANFSTKTCDYVAIDGKQYHTITEVDENYIYTVAVTSMAYFEKIANISHQRKIIKINGIPFLENSLKPVSITNHGRFERKITLIDS